MSRFRKCAFIVFVILIIIDVFINDFTQYSRKIYAQIEPDSPLPQHHQQNHSLRYNILFLKTHKCASTTVQNILMRFGLRHSLNFVLPKNYNYLGYFNNFSSSLLAPQTKTKDGKYNILAHHTRYSASLKNIMYNDTAIVTILRDPATLFESLFHFYSFQHIYHISFEDLLDLLPSPKALEILKNKPNRRRKHGRNQMSRDLGLEETSFTNITEIEKFVQKIDEEFHYVMIAERFDESLVLLADLMKWPLRYVTYLPLNSRQSGNKYNLSEADRVKLRKFNNADAILYEYFLKKFQKSVLQYGVESLNRDVRRLQLYNRQLREKCVSKENTKGYAKTVNYELKNISECECVHFTESELRFTNELRYVQTKRLHSFTTKKP